MLIIEDVKKSFNTKPVLKGISLTINNGEICGLLGLNGAGKSTLMKIISGLDFADSGNIYIDGNLKKPGEEASDIGAMIETPSFFSYLSAYKNMEYFWMLCPSIPKERIEQVLKIVGLENTGNLIYSKFSLGMKQRLYFACALLKKPSLLILDEPFSNVDPVSVKLFEDIIKVMANNGTAVLISGHIIAELKNVCNSSAFLNNGIIEKRFESIQNIDLEKEFLSTVSRSGDII